jgi:hypothetical protein
LAEALRAFPEFNAFRKGRRMVILEDLVIVVLVERELKGERVPEPLSIQQVWDKNVWEIHREIRAAQENPGEHLGDLSQATWVKYIPLFLMKLFFRWADRNLYFARRYGKIGVTAVGMFSKGASWFLPVGGGTLVVTVGGIGEKVVETEKGFESREHLCLTFSFNHDIIDGAPGARFISHFSDLMKEGKGLDSI